MNESSNEIKRTSSSSRQVTRREFLKASASAAAIVALRRSPRPIFEMLQLSELERVKNNIGNYEETAKDILANNTKGGKIIPSAAYSNGEWMRDGTWSILGLQDPNLGQAFFKRFLQHQNTTGQIPTCILDDGTTAINDDESTPAFVLLGYSLKKNGYQFSPQENDALIKALKYCESRLDDKGFWNTRKGGFQTWHDSVIFTDGDIPSYTQGIISAAFEAGKQLFPQDNNYAALSEKTRNNYNALYTQGLKAQNFLPLSTKYSDIADVSSLFGEFLSLQLFNQSLLSDSVVLDTLNSFQKVNSVGYKVLSKNDGSYLPIEQFYPPTLNPPGTYHNGGSWFAYDLASLLVAHYHGKDVINEISNRIESELKYKKTLWEFLDTNPKSPNFGKAEDLRQGYSWNIVCLPLLKRLMGELTSTLLQ